MDFPAKRRGTAKGSSHWFVPLGVFAVTAFVSAVLLAYYLSPLRPAARPEQPAPTDSAGLVALRVGKAGFHIPANYILFASARGAKAVDQLDLVALLPDLQGYTLTNAAEFSSDAPESRVLNLSVRRDDAPATTNILERDYLPMVENPEGTPAQYGLTAYAFRADSEYRDDDLFVGDSDEGPLALRCEKPHGNAVSNCIGEIPLANDLLLVYRFKRTHLDIWHETASGIRALIGAFMDKT